MRERLDTTPAKAPPKRVAPKGKSPAQVTFSPSGCTTLDCALGGGWAKRRVINIVGDKSVGKTLLAFEAAANFLIKERNGRVKYDECESAFDPRYLANLGVPIERINFGERLNTVEDMFDSLNDSIKLKVPVLEIVDSLDALSDKAELDREFGEATYGTGKARDLSKLFRMLVRDMERSHLTLMIISQVRTRIGAMFGRKTIRAGGLALDFYASQVVYLQHIATINRTVANVKRPVAYDILAKVDKNKVGPPLREAPFTLEFGYGIDDFSTCMAWLKEVGHLEDVGCTERAWKQWMRKVNDSTDPVYKTELAKVQKVVRTRWAEIESGFLPKRRKYNGI
jgi:recombination protein RecA